MPEKDGKTLNANEIARLMIAVHDEVGKSMKGAMSRIEKLEKAISSSKDMKTLRQQIAALPKPERVNLGPVQSRISEIEAGLAKILEEVSRKKEWVFDIQTDNATGDPKRVIARER